MPTNLCYRTGDEITLLGCFVAITFTTTNRQNSRQFSLDWFKGNLEKVSHIFDGKNQTILRPIFCASLKKEATCSASITMVYDTYETIDNNLFMGSKDI